MVPSFITVEHNYLQVHVHVHVHIHVCTTRPCMITSGKYHHTANVSRRNLNSRVGSFIAAPLSIASQICIEEYKIV